MFNAGVFCILESACVSVLAAFGFPSEVSVLLLVVIVLLSSVFSCLLVFFKNYAVFVAIFGFL